MKYVVNEQVTLSQPLEGPLKAHIASFAQWAGEQGYALSYVRRKVRIAGWFSRWLGEKRVRLRDVSSEHVARYLRCLARRVRPHQGDAAGLRQLIDFLRRRRVIRAHRIVPRRLTPVERCAEAFERFLREERGLASATVINYVPFIRCFLQKRFGKDRVRAIELVCRRRRDIRTASGAAAAPEASKAVDHCAAVLPEDTRTIVATSPLIWPPPFQRWPTGR